MASHPIFVISSKPTLRHVGLEVFLHMVLICRENPGTTIVEIDLHNAKTRCVPRCMTHVNPWSNFQEVSMERRPIEIEREVLGQVNSNIRFGGNRIECMLELGLVDVNRDTRAFEILQSTGVVQVEVTHYDRFNVLDVMASFLDLILDLMVLGILDSSEDVVERCAPNLRVILTTSRFE
jgi:hypothetical protein